MRRAAVGERRTGGRTDEPVSVGPGSGGRQREARTPEGARHQALPVRRSPIPIRHPPNPFRHAFLTARPFWALGALAAGFVVAFFVGPLLAVMQLAVVALAVLVVADVVLLWGSGGAVTGARAVPDKLSLGDENPVEVTLGNTYAVPIAARVIDEVPVQFQDRTDGTVVPLAAGASGAFTYTLRPTTRGAYAFGRLLVYATTPLGLVARRFVAADGGEAAVYPSILQMRRFAFLADRDRLREVGVKRVRRRGHTMEFDQIRDYVAGDDRRAVNWKATARRSAYAPRLMVNTYQDEREQPVVVALDMGRAMRSPFDGLTLLDHAVNAALVVLNTALQTQDRAGLVAFDREVQTVIAPDRKRGQLGAFLGRAVPARPRISRTPRSRRCTRPSAPGSASGGWCC